MELQEMEQAGLRENTVKVQNRYAVGPLWRETGCKTTTGYLQRITDKKGRFMIYRPERPGPLYSVFFCMYVLVRFCHTGKPGKKQKSPKKIMYNFFGFSFSGGGGGGGGCEIGEIPGEGIKPRGWW